MGTDLFLFLAAGFLGGAVNVAAGGAKLFVFPLLLAAGLSPVAAAATGTLALWPAQIPGVLVFRKSLPGSLGALAIDCLVAAAGGIAGALLLVGFGEGPLLALVPVFLILAVAAILAGGRLRSWAEARGPSEARPLAARIFYFFCGVYAGYFGAGLGFMILAGVLVFAGEVVHAANARKNLVAVAANTSAVVPLALSGVVVWPAAAAVLVGGLIGGYGGARLIRLMPAHILRYLVASLGTVLTLSYLVRTWAG